jgi:putative intracellular protease/amidase
MKRIVFVLTNHDRKGSTGQPTGFYLPEAAHPWAILDAAGYAVDFVSPQGGVAPMDGADNPDSACQRFLDTPSIMAKVQNTLRPDQAKATDYAGIFYVGGHGTMWDFPDSEGIARLAAEIYEAGGIIGAVCHGPAGLVNLKLSDGHYLVEGKRVAAFTDNEERAVNLQGVVPFLLASTLQQRGAIHVPAPNWQANVVIDGRLISGQNPASAEGVGREMVRLLN